MAITANEYFENAKQLQLEGRLQEALKEYRHALLLNPELIGAHINIGSVLGEMGRWEDAVKELETAREQYPHLDTAAYALGVAYTHVGRIEEAQSFLKEALDHGRIPDAAHKLLEVTREIYWKNIASQFDSLLEVFNSGKALPLDVYHLIHASASLIARGPKRDFLFADSMTISHPGALPKLLTLVSEDEKNRLALAGETLSKAVKSLKEQHTPFISHRAKLTLKDGTEINCRKLEDIDDVIGSAFECVIGDEVRHIPFGDLAVIKCVRESSWLEMELHYISGQVSGVLAPVIYPRSFMSKELEIRNGLRFARKMLVPDVSLGFGTKHYRADNQFIPLSSIQQIEILYEI